MASQTLLSRLHSDIRACEACPLRQEAIRPVHGTGPEDAKIVFIGQNPSVDEDIQGQLFTSDTILDACGLTRDEVYVTNVLLCHTHKERVPTNLEVEVCADFFLGRLLTSLKPYLVVTFGLSAAHYLAGTKSLGPVHGVARMDATGFWHIPCYHPVNDTLNKSIIDAFEFDIVQVRRFLNHRQQYIDRLAV